MAWVWIHFNIWKKQNASNEMKAPQIHSSKQRQRGEKELYIS